MEQQLKTRIDRLARRIGAYQRSDYRALRATPLFDVAWYRHRYPDIARLGDPVRHYLCHGVDERRAPGPLFDAAWYLRTNLDVAGRNPLLHFVTHGWREGRFPNPLFDVAWYLAVNPDVAASGINPLEHFLRYGAAEGRDPCPLFSSQWYFEQYPDIVRGEINPLVHYLQDGAREGRRPNPYFDSAWYLARYPDVERSGENPLGHYLHHGWREGRDPSALFDAAKYRRDYPDIEAAGIDSLTHYLRLGRNEDRRFPRRLPAWNEYLPSARQRKVPHACIDLPVPVDVIVPVYRGREETLRCIDSVMVSPTATAQRLHVINDASPDPELTAELRHRAERGDFRYSENARNFGFVGTVNRGMRDAAGADVVLLNSDTEVAPGWLDRLVGQAYAADDIGTVTPLSNNATICSYPDFQGRRQLPQGEDVTHLDQAAQEANAGRGVDIPTAVGYCMYIRRDCLDAVGLFDEEAFGRGYGEENDFCLRASALGWRHRLACDTFVYHAGETSFQGDASEGKRKAAAILRTRHPHYDRNVAAHVAEDPAAPYRLALTAARWRASGRPAVLFVNHALGGGTERHLQDLIATTGEGQHVLVLRPARTADGGCVELSNPDPYDGFRVQLGGKSLPKLAELLRSFGVLRAHVHHALGFAFDLARLLRLTGVAFDFTAHDYFAVCPQINLIGPTGRYCGEPEPGVCDNCIRQRPALDAQDIRSWRLRHQWLLRDAEQVFCPSQDVARRLRRYEPEARCVVVPHEPSPSASLRTHARLPRDHDRFRIAVLGVLAPHKGRDVVLALARYAALYELPLDFVVIGQIEGTSIASLPPTLRETGRYKEEELPRHIEAVDPHVIYFPAQWPETYSYTLSAALTSGRAIAAPALGAFAERLQGMPWCWLLPDVAVTTEALVARLLGICREHLATGWAPALPMPLAKTVAPQREWEAAYGGQHAPRLAKQHTDLRRDGIVSALVVCEWLKQAPSPCASIRLLQPLEALGERVRWRVVRLDEIERYRADVVITHRTALRSVVEVERLAKHARHGDMPIVYDLDDNFLDLDPDAESGKYRSQIRAVTELLKLADEVWVSTPALAERVAAVTRVAPVVVRNAWMPAIWGAVPQKPLEQGNEAPVNILYMGTRTHREDFELIEPALMRLKQRHRERVNLHLIGVVPLDCEPDTFHAPYPPPLVGGSYPAFVSWLRSINNWHIGLSPLLDTPFNRCKSEIKLIDYAALGLASVASDLGCYRQVIRHGETGLLVAESTDDWFDVLDELVGDKTQRERLRKNAAGLLAGATLEGEAVRRLRRLRTLSVRQDMPLHFSTSHEGFLE